MIPSLDFKDPVKLYRPTGFDEDGKAIYAAPVQLLGLFDQRTTYGHAGGQDAVGGTGSFLYLPGDHATLVEYSYRLEGWVASINLFDEIESFQQFKILSVVPAADKLLGNRVRHIECDLTLVDAGDAIPEAS